MFSPEAASEDRRRLEQGRLHDPFRFLGRHELGGGDIVIRAFLPGAGRAWIVEGGRPMTRAGEGDVFEWSGSPEGLPARYTIGAEVDGIETASVDPYAFPPQLAEGDLDGFGRGEHFRAHRFMGSRCHVADGVEGALFAVWAPEAERVSVVGNFNRWDGRRHPMRGRGRSGIWELFVPGLGAGDLYKYELRNRSTAEILVKSDPFARVAELRPRTASIVPAPADFTWTDADWMTRRAAWDWQAGPISIYEVHAGSWRRGGNGRFLTYREMADLLADELRGLGFTHVEFMPLTEHPLDASWGYQTSGYFAPTSRHGSPDDLRYLVDRLHGAGIGIILDWVPGHFPTDEHALARFDGSCLYEYADTRKGTHREWGTLVFNFGRNEVRSFLISSAAYWMEEFHVDGLRVDAVASMLYLDYSRGHGEWAPNPFGGNEHLEAIDFLKRFNEVTHGQFPGTITIAEESTAWPGVTRPTWDGGLGFSLKWNMGWMHDTLEYMTEDPVHRRHHHDRITFGAMYAFSENFVLPLSHDEVVHGKRSLLGRMPGDEWQRLANLRLLYAFQWTFPGKKLLFMGSEVAQAGEWDHSRALPAPGPGGNAVRRLVSDLNAMYRREPALHAGDLRQDGFEWLRWDDASSSVLAYLRRSGGEEIVVLLNFTPVPRHGYRVGVTSAGSFVEILNSDSRFYGGSDIGNPGELFAAEIPSMGRSWSFVANLPPLAGVVFRRTC